MRTINYVLNGEMLSLQDIAVFDDQQDILSKDAVAKQNAQQYSEENIPLQDVHNTFEPEQTVMTIVRKSATAALRERIKAVPAVRGGMGAEDKIYSWYTYHHSLKSPSQM